MILRKTDLIQFLEHGREAGLPVELAKEFVIWWLQKGGKGSGNFGHSGRLGYVGGSTPGGGLRSQRARETYVPATAEVQRRALENQLRLAKHLGGKSTEDNHPFDVLAGDHVVEVKTIIHGRNDKITMHPESLRRKISYAARHNVIPHTVVFDDRHGYVYYARGVGGFRLSAMQKTTLEEVVKLIKRRS